MSRAWVPWWLAGLLTGCPGEPGLHRVSAMPPGDSAAVVPGRVIVTGRVVVSGPLRPVTRLYLEEGRSIGITGELLGEIQRLTGAKLSVVGDSAPDQGLYARHYAVLEVNGEKPYVGVVIRNGGSIALSREAGVLELDSLGSAQLGEFVGAKVWVTGRQYGARLRVVSYGVIRPQ